MAHSISTPASRLVSVGVASRLLGLSLNTVRAMCDRGELQHVTTLGKHRRISLRSINRWMGLDEPEDSIRKTAFYARVSGRIQKQQGNLDRQAERLREYCVNELDEQEENIIAIAEQGSGLSETRKGYLRLLDLVISCRINRIVVEHRDRLARYGVVVLESLCERFDVEIIITNAPEDVSEDEEMTSDILSLVTVYAARRHGKRGGDAMRMPLTDEVKQRVLQLHAQGVGQLRITKMIQAEGYRCEKTGKLFAINAVRKALKEHEKLTRATSTLVPETSGTLQQFLKEHCIASADESARCFTRPLHNAYSEWCKAKGIEIPTSKWMTIRLKKLGYQTGHNGSGFHFVKGLTLKGNDRASRSHLA